jgi:squalene-hopene/tetraprenyl-beta-curcumene cyclase
LKFIVESARADGSWPIDTNLATWVTTLSINALGTRDGTEHLTPELLAWVLGCQHTERHPFTGADPGGWGWSDLSGAVPDADDTPSALLALHTIGNAGSFATDDSTIRARAGLGVDWLLSLQNRDYGWPTFCRGWGRLPFDRSGTDLTAHALRALKPHSEVFTGPWGEPGAVDDAVERGFSYLAKQQRPDGSWLPLWFGNQHRDDDENPLYGTAKVLLVYRDLDRMGDEPARRAVDYLVGQQNSDGGWGGSGSGGGRMGSGEWGMGNEETKAPTNVSECSPSGVSDSPSEPVSSVEETALVVEALQAAYERPEIVGLVGRRLTYSPGQVRSAVDQGLLWLIQQVESGGFRRPSPIGFYFAKLWYYERLYPIIFTVGALRVAVESYHRMEAPES